jgi:hypothetical protein
MTKQEFYDKIKAQLEERLQLIKSKNSDYTGDNDEPFFCFIEAAKRSGITVEQGIEWEIQKKLTRLRGLLDGNSPNYESIDDTLDDIQNYRLIKQVWLSKEVT